jgi:hypothetical protein
MGSELSVTELAERIARPRVVFPSGEDPRRIELTTRRLRHWTMSGLLPTAGDLHTGPGRSRTYDREIVYVAAVLDVLADLGLGIGPLATCARYLLKHARGKNPAPAKALWSDAVKGQAQVYGLYWAQGSDAETRPPGSAFTLLNGEELGSMKGAPWLGAVLIDLTATFARLIQ